MRWNIDSIKVRFFQHSNNIYDSDDKCFTSKSIDDYCIIFKLKFSYIDSRKGATYKSYMLSEKDILLHLDNLERFIKSILKKAIKNFISTMPRCVIYYKNNELSNVTDENFYGKIPDVVEYIYRQKKDIFDRIINKTKNDMSIADIDDEAKAHKNKFNRYAKRHNDSGILIKSKYKPVQTLPAINTLYFPIKDISKYPLLNIY